MLKMWCVEVTMGSTKRTCYSYVEAFKSRTVSSVGVSATFMSMFDLFMVCYGL